MWGKEPYPVKKSGEAPIAMASRRCRRFDRDSMRSKYVSMAGRKLEVEGFDGQAFGAKNKDPLSPRW